MIMISIKIFGAPFKLPFDKENHEKMVSIGARIMSKFGKSIFCAYVHYNTIYIILYDRLLPQALIDCTSMGILVGIGAECYFGSKKRFEVNAIQSKVDVEAMIRSTAQLLYEDSVENIKNGETPDLFGAEHIVSFDRLPIEFKEGTFLKGTSGDMPRNVAHDYILRDIKF